MSEICQRLHDLFNHLPRHRFPYDEQAIPQNGIYVLFEQGERAHGADRIVRVGTHTGANQLRSRLKQHFINPNKDRSILRKNIGRIILHKAEDPFLEQWEWDLTTRKNRDLYMPLLDREKQAETEQAVSDYIHKNFSFVVFRVDEKAQRLEFEKKIIATLSWCAECYPSKKWLGLHSLDKKIRSYGLWLIQGLNKEPLTNAGFAELQILAIAG